MFSPKVMDMHEKTEEIVSPKPWKYLAKLKTEGFAEKKGIQSATSC